MSAAVAQAGQVGTPIPYGTRTPCAHFVHTMCAARACMYADPFAFLRACVAGRARLAGLESKSVLPAIADLYVVEHLAVSTRTASCGPGKCVRSGPWLGLWTRSVLGLVRCHFLYEKCVCVREKRHFSRLAPKRRSRMSFLCEGGARKKVRLFMASGGLEKVMWRKW